MQKGNLLLVLLFVCVLSYGQDQSRSGIFLTLKCTTNIPRYDPILSSKSVCLTPNPILPSSEFVAVTELKGFRNRIYFDLKLSEKANQTLKKLATNLPNSGLTIVVNDLVISVFKASDIKIGGSIRFIGSLRYRDAFALAHQSLQDLIALPKEQ